jgi:pimeloyl-ACP methyl ester carboxylesterase
MTERMVETDGVELCTEPFGDPDAPPVLLLMGIGGSMLWWDEAFCRMLADRGRFVIRYDLRDAGRSVTYEPGRPGYTGQDLVRDVVGVLDGYDLPSAHLVGLSAGGGIAQEVALCFPDRVRSLVLLGTSPVTAVDRPLPPPSDAYLRFVREVEVDWSSPASVVEYQVAYSRVLAGAVRPFDERAARQLAEAEATRARDLAALQNHDLVAASDAGVDAPLSSIAVPTLVLHGSEDPAFPPDHGRALAEAIPGAQFLLLDGAGHGLERPDWDVVATALAEHTEPPGAT